MDSTQDFKVNTTSFANLTLFKSELESKNLKLMVAVNPYLTANTENDYYNDAQDSGLLIMSSINTDNNYQGALI
jgi:alpha-glucosidase (family GH31 glycosyl hydrolase)